MQADGNAKGVVAVVNARVRACVRTSPRRFDVIKDSRGPSSSSSCSPVPLVLPSRCGQKRGEACFENYKAYKY